MSSAAATAPCLAPKLKADTPHDLAVAMLHAVPGVSPKIVRALVHEYSSMPELIKAVNSDSTLMHNFKVGARKLGKVGDRITGVLRGGFP